MVVAERLEIVLLASIKFDKLFQVTTIATLAARDVGCFGIFWHIAKVYSLAALFGFDVRPTLADFYGIEVDLHAFHSTRMGFDLVYTRGVGKSEP